ncbi:MFS general substrate transporter [Schizophyllum commune H4-8]|uniref:MFS general substrate transporter n=1 Tax=Schizophyllum commune (strain H4-8 / FGSC 9210) TaxID=578458 RepID=UPI00215E0F21|nr:MFS general substrate transporter [Schizophyllum commune H4-8]KAI5896136.1 MFS general substrate transporter [Schizophyllum commune H4-8]
MLPSTRVEGLAHDEGSSLHPILQDARQGTQVHSNSPPSRASSFCTVFGAFLALLFSFGNLSAFGTFQAWYMHNQFRGFPSSTIAWIGSAQLFMFFASGACIGHLCDAYGPGWLLLSGGLSTTFSILMTSLSTEFYQFLFCQGVLFGLGAGMLFYPAMTSVSSHFTAYRATALGIVATGSSVGGVIFPIMLERLFSKIGFAWTLRVVGLFNAAGCLLAWLLVSSRATAKGIQSPIFDHATSRDEKYMLLVAGSCLVSFGLYTPPTFIVSFAQSYGITSARANTALVVLNAASAFGRLLPAYLADRAGNFNLLAPAAALCGVACLAVAASLRGLSACVSSAAVISTLPSAPGACAPSLASIIAFAAIYGFLSGAFISVVTPCVAQISPAGRVGARVGMLYSAISVPSLLAGPIAGALLHRADGSYTGMMLYAGITILCGSILIVCARMQTEGRLLAKV